jgi:Gas vesicle synthesis protein GvpL/GvpF
LNPTKKSSTVTYVYCVVAADRRPRLTRVPAGLPGAGPVRLLDVGKGLFMAVADLPLDRYGESAINKGLADLDWVSRVAVAHEAVVESFIAAVAVLPMKLFTIFTTDDRALDHVRAQRPRIAALVKRVANQQEWGIRVVLDRTLAAALPKKKAPARAGSGVSYLAQKKAQRDSSRELASRARETVAGLFERLAARSGDAKRRAASELPAQGGPLLLDAAFLVPRARSTAFKALAARESRTLARQGYGLTVSGPWPPYTFVQD